VSRVKRRSPLFFAIVLLLGCVLCARAGQAGYAAERAEMVEKLRRSGISNQEVLAAMSRVPRHEFVAPGDETRAYHDVSIPVPGGQALPPPSVVAAALDKLDPKPGQKILQVGTECAYCTALLCEITRKVYVADYRPKALALAKTRIAVLGYSWAKWLECDACKGWPEQGPYDAILVMCAADQVPDALMQQLKVGGHMVIPIGQGPEQTVQCLTKMADGKQRAEIVKLPKPMRVDPMMCQRPPSRESRPAK
jgi:protein-L-isoaspartate(D-aspartate) O-methyltransferase